MVLRVPAEPAPLADFQRFEYSLRPHNQATRPFSHIWATDGMSTQLRVPSDVQIQRAGPVDSYPPKHCDDLSADLRIFRNSPDRQGSPSHPKIFTFF